MFEPNEVLQTVTGLGHVSAEGIDAVRVRYRLIIERRDGMVVGSGTLSGLHDKLRPIWLKPDATLRLKSGKRVEISITDLVGDLAEFESTGKLSPV
jgi:hypothetical protein